jgi:hypothetical protein
MKRYKTLFISVLLLWGQSVFGQYFLKSYDFPPFTAPRSTDIGRSIEPVTPVTGGSPFGWTIAGFSNSSALAGGYNWMFLKTSSAGTVSCATLLGFSFDDSCFSHTKFVSSSINVLAGFYTASSMGILKEKASWSMVDTSCGHVMSRQIADTARHQYRWVTRTPSNTFTLTGWIQRFTTYGAVDYIIASQYTPAGALVWAYEYLPPYPYVTERAYSIVYQPTDGSYAITGTTNRFTGPAGPLQVFVMKISAAGIPIWFKGYSSMPGAPSQSRRIVALPDGGFAICGWSPAFDPANDVYIFKVDAAGTPVWSFTYGMPTIREEAYGMIYQPSDMSLIFTGLTTGGEDILTGKVTAAAGAPVWFRAYPNAAGADRGYDLEEAASPTGYAVTGQLYASASASLDPFLMRTNSLGIVASGCLDSLILQPRPSMWTDICGRNIRQLPDIQIQPQVTNPAPQTRDLCGLTGIQQTFGGVPDKFALEQNYPNPFNPVTVIGCRLSVAGYVTLKVHDIQGKEVAVLVNGEMPAGNYQIEFDASNYPSGIYFYTLTTNGFSETKRMMLVK